MPCREAGPSEAATPGAAFPFPPSLVGDLSLLHPTYFFESAPKGSKTWASEAVLGDKTTFLLTIAEAWLLLCLDSGRF